MLMNLVPTLQRGGEVEAVWMCHNTVKPCHVLHVQSRVYSPVQVAPIVLMDGVAIDCHEAPSWFHQ